MSENLNGDQQSEDTDIIREQPARGAGGNASSSGNASRRKLQIPNEEQLMAALFQLPPMMMTGMMSTAQASVSKAVYTAILQNLRQPKANSGGTTMSAPRLIDVLRQNPSMLDALEPIFTREQFKEMKKQMNGESEAA